MKRAINIFIAATLMFLLILGFSSLVGEVMSHVVYAAACIIPTLFVFFSKCEGACSGKARYLTIDTPRIITFLPTVFPIVCVTMALSALTSIVMSVTLGISNVKTPEELGGNIIVAILLHALVPAVLEELLFRYVPLCLFAHRSPRCALILSSLFFALVHTDFFVIPYALFAGVAFMVLDNALDSIYPSIILHFINNAISVFFIFFQEDAVAITAFYVLLSVLTIVSGLFILLKRRSYLDLTKRAFSSGEGYKISNEVLLVIVPCLVLSAVRLAGALVK